MAILPYISSCSCADTKVSKRVLPETSAVAFDFGGVQAPPTVVGGVQSVGIGQGVACIGDSYWGGLLLAFLLRKHGALGATY